jgi:GNAT superfamily N-acetyltransferase
MPRVRFWQPSDLPYLLSMAALTTWNITPEDDRPHTSFEVVARSAHQNMVGVLQSPYGTAIVAEEGGRPVGYLLIGIQLNGRSREPVGYMADIYVEPAFRRSGLSKHFLAIGEEYLRRIGIRKATNWTHAHNPLGQASSNHQGFKLWGLMLAKDLQAGASLPQLQGAGL